MNQQRSQCRTAPRPRPLSADFFSHTPIMSDERQSSMLYSMLPSAVQNRLPRLPSLRRSVSAYGATGKGKSKSAPNSPPKTRPGTPDETEAYGAVVLRESTTAALALERSSETERRRALEVTEQSSGIGWKFAGQGTNRCHPSSSHRLT